EQTDFEFMKAQAGFQSQAISQQQNPLMPQLHEHQQQQQAVLVAQTDPKKIIKE
ncbi:unnamed protein product, partial [marine sediment metagenome]